MTLSISDVIDLASKGGVLAVLAIVVWGFWTEHWVSGAAYQRLLKERDAFRDELLTTLRVVDRATRVTERSIDVAGSRLEAEHRFRSRRKSQPEEENDE